MRTKAETWEERHARAVTRPNAVEQPIVTLLQQVGSLSARYAEDQVLREGIAHILQGVRILVMNGDTGRLDPGTVDHAIVGLMEVIGFDPDAEDFR